MDKKRLFSIMARAKADIIAELAGDIKQRYEIVIIKKPDKTLTMIKMREPVKNSLFYLGEVIVSEAAVELEGVKGMAVTLGDDFEKALNMAIIDAACNKEVFARMDILLELEKQQAEFEQKENAMHLKTMVSFNTMDPGATV